eukprot:1160959-Pelagomonas_calceolata.AAC.2
MSCVLSASKSPHPGAHACPLAPDCSFCSLVVGRHAEHTCLPVFPVRSSRQGVLQCISPVGSGMSCHSSDAQPSMHATGKEA